MERTASTIRRVSLILRSAKNGGKRRNVTVDGGQL